jgi:hypothetical protein
MNDPRTTPMYPPPGESPGDPSAAPNGTPAYGTPGRSSYGSPYGPGYQQPEPQPDSGPRLNAGRLWAGGAATAIVTALLALVGVCIGRGIFAVPVPVPALNGLSSAAYVGLAALAALVATGLLHMLIMVAPRPLAFFGWIVFLATLGAVLMPWVNTFFGSYNVSHIPFLNSKIATTVINLAVGIAIGSLMSGVARSAVTYRPRIPVPPQGYPGEGYSEPGPGYRGQGYPGQGYPGPGYPGQPMR